MGRALIRQPIEEVLKNSENHTIGELLLGDGVVLTIDACLRVAATVRVALATEPIKSAAHIHFLLCTHVENGEVERRAA